MSPRQHFTEEQLEAIRAATAAVEKRTSGEIVAVVVPRCDPYEEAHWKAATLGALAAALAAAALYLGSGVWGGAIGLWLAVPAVLGAGLGFLLARLWPALLRALVPVETLERRARRRAAQAFLDEEVFATRDRTGILIFLGLFERRVEILADSGIRARVDPEVWSAMAERLARGMREDRAPEALQEAVAACGRVLEEHGLAPRPDDEDELADGVRLRDA